MSKILSILFFALFFNATYFSALAETEATAEEYIQKFKGISISEMKKYGIPASIKLAQGLLESGMGTSKLAVYGNNHFGIKCHTVWTGATMKHTDDAVDECFRVYSDPNDSYKDHSQFLLTRPRYASLFKLKSNDYKGWANGLREAGYATNPRYANMIIDVIERHQLYVYDMDLSETEMEKYRNQLVSQEKETLIALQKQNVKIESNQASVLLSRANRAPNVPNHSGVVFYNNKVKVIRLQKGETLKDISKRYDLSLNKLRDFNDLTTKQDIAEGQLVYISAKRKKAKQKKHLVLSYETVWSISQMYGIRLDKILEKNYLKNGEEPATGTTLNLRKKADKKPLLKTEKMNNSSQISVPVVNKEEMILQAKPSPVYKNPENNFPTIPSINYRPFTFAPTAASAPAENISTPTPTGNYIYHTVQTGDTMYNISKKYQVDIEQIKSWNGMLDYNIQLNQQLIIYQ